MSDRPLALDRAVSAARGAWGAALLVAPERLLASVAAGEPLDARARAFARALGVRQLLEAALLRRAGARAVALGAAVDGVHALSVLALAAADRSRRREALANALVATGFAIEGATRARQAADGARPIAGRTG